MLDNIEAGNAEPDIQARLAQRRQRRGELVNRCERLRRGVQEPQPEPTEEWVAGQLQALSRTLQGEGPAAALALRRLVGGQVLVREVRLPGHKRHATQASFVLRSTPARRART